MINGECEVSTDDNNNSNNSNRKNVDNEGELGVRNGMPQDDVHAVDLCLVGVTSAMWPVFCSG
jgi:hypothetical protein